MVFKKWVSSFLVLICFYNPFVFGCSDVKVNLILRVCIAFRVKPFLMGSIFIGLYQEFKIEPLLFGICMVHHS